MNIEETKELESKISDLHIEITHLEEQLVRLQDFNHSTIRVYITAQKPVDPVTVNDNYIDLSKKSIQRLLKRIATIIIPSGIVIFLIVYFIRKRKKKKERKKRSKKIRFMD
jgi:hypothetical protein